MSGLDQESGILLLATRRGIYETVRRNAGCHLREIQRLTGLPFGSVSYHLSYLVRHDLLRTKKEGNTLRYFPLDTSSDDQELLTLLRQQSVRSILLFVFSNDCCTHREIAVSTKLSASTTTWHLKKLLDAGVIKMTRSGKFNSYRLAAPRERIMALLIAYRESFLDRLVDGLIDLWERREE